MICRGNYRKPVRVEQLCWDMLEGADGFLPPHVGFPRFQTAIKPSSNLSQQNLNSGSVCICFFVFFKGQSEMIWII